MPRPGNAGLKGFVKNLAARAVRPGVMPLMHRFDRLEAQLGRGRMDAAKLRAELDYWRWFIRGGGCEKQHGEPFAVLFGRWQRHRLLKLANVLDIPQDDRPGNIDDWCAQRSVVEIGAGPYPAIAAARKGWKRAVAIDPLARSYVDEGLMPAPCANITCVQAVGEDVPLPSNCADLVICENSLSSVNDPVAVVGEMFRLLRPGGHLWFFVDLSTQRDLLHPHPMTEQRIAELFAAFTPGLSEITPHTAHPRAFAALRAHFRKPALAPEPAVYAAPRPSTVGLEIKARPSAPVFRINGQEEPRTESAPIPLKEHAR